jgi:protein-S-isoprenylcysteine O-methyltransferase Ste14
VPSLAPLVARLRVTLGFLCGIAVFLLAAPTPRSIAIGVGIAAIGQLIRVWAAGHLNKAREVTTSGPYRWVAHPLYVGSTVMGIGLAVASASYLVAAFVVLYLTVTLTAAITSEQAYLRQKFGDGYDRYMKGQPRASSSRRFSVRQAIANREYRAVAGFLLAVLLLVLKAQYDGAFR